MKEGFEKFRKVFFFFFLENHAGHLESESNRGSNISENFTQLLVLEATRNK